MSTLETSYLKNRSSAVNNIELAVDGSSAIYRAVLPSGSSGDPSLRFSGDSDTGIYSIGPDILGVATSGVKWIEVSTTAVSSSLPIDVPVGTSGTPSIVFTGDTNTGIYSPGTDQLAVSISGLERARIDSSGRLLVGTTSAVNVGGYGSADIQAYFQSGGAAASIAVINTGNNVNAPILHLAKSRGGTSTVVASGDNLGAIRFSGADGTDIETLAAQIFCSVDGTPGSNDMPGRLVFSTTADGAATPTERMRITSNGYLKATSDASYLSAVGVYHELRQSASNEPSVWIQATNASYASAIIASYCQRAANSAYQFYTAYSNGLSDIEFNLRGDGTGLCDGTWTGGGADYAEYFEWSDGNPDEEDRRGISVVLDGDKIREALPNEDPIGVISGNPSVVGDAAWNKWSGKYLRDEYGTYIQEDYEVEDEDGNTVIQQRRKLNPAYDPDVEYVSRENRPEWDCVGLMGKLRIRKGQATGSRWIKMRDINDSVEEWLVR